MKYTIRVLLRNWYVITESYITVYGSVEDIPGAVKEYASKTGRDLEYYHVIREEKE